MPLTNILACNQRDSCAEVMDRLIQSIAKPSLELLKGIFLREVEERNELQEVLISSLGWPLDLVQIVLVYFTDPEDEYVKMVKNKIQTCRVVYPEKVNLFRLCVALRRTKSLTDLDVSNQGLSKDELTAIASTLQDNRSLLSLNLSANIGLAQAAPCILDTLTHHPSTLTNLNLATGGYQPITPSILLAINLLFTQRSKMTTQA